MNKFKLMGIHDVLLFGLFKGSSQAKGRDIEEDFNDYKNYKNIISKKEILNYLKSIEPQYLAPMTSYDMFTDEELDGTGYVIDGEFAFPLDFIHYYENYDIGIPPEYELYIKTKIK